MKKIRIGFELGRTSRLLCRYINTGTAKLQADEMTGTHGRAIGYFYRNRDRDIFQKDFEKEFDIRRSTASNILSLMEKNGLIVRQSVPYDARLRKIQLTPKAEGLHRELEAFFDNMEQELSKGISDEEMEFFVFTLNKIKGNIERMSDENDKAAE